MKLFLINSLKYFVIKFILVLDLCQILGTVVSNVHSLAVSVIFLIQVLNVGL